MADGMMLLQAAADTANAYRDFPVIGSRAAIWIAAEIHLMFAAFVLGVPIFAVVAEAIGIFGKDQRYDRLAKEFTRLLLIAYSATDRKSTRLNSSHRTISYAVFCLKKKKTKKNNKYIKITSKM